MKAIRERKSVKKFSTKKPDWRDIIECVEAARYAPMAGNNFSLKFVLIKDEKTINKLAQASQQPFVATAHWVVVVCTNPRRTKIPYQDSAEKYLRQQAGAAIENFLLKIQEKKMATCWVGHFVEDQVKKAIDASDDIDIEAIFPIGYESAKKGQQLKPKRKSDLDSFLYFEKYKNKKMQAPIKKLDV